MQRSIVGFHEDADGVWVAELECGHRQHVRHEPPWQNRAWIGTAEGRTSKLGIALDCAYCDMPSLPPGAHVFRKTQTFSNESVPQALLTGHITQRGVWARILVEEGQLQYLIFGERPAGFLLRPGIDGVIAPEQPHRVRPLGATRFYIEFYRCEPGSKEPAGDGDEPR